MVSFPVYGTSFGESCSLKTIPGIRFTDTGSTAIMGLFVEPVDKSSVRRRAIAALGSLAGLPILRMGLMTHLEIHRFERATDG